MNGKLTNRKHYIDIARGVAITLVVIGHGVSEYSTGLTGVERVIYSFHMPLFFVISGLVFRVKSGDTVKSFAKKRAKGLMLPYLLFAVLIFASHLAERFVFKTDSEFFKTLKTPSGILNTLLLTNKSAFSNLWFLPCMFAAQVILFVIFKFIKNKWIVALCCTVPSVAIIFISPQISLPLSLEAAVVSLLFIYIGTLIQKADIKKKTEMLMLPAAIFAFCTSQAFYFTYYNDKAFSYYNVQFEVPWLFCLTAISGSLLIILFAHRQKEVPVSELLGRHSLYIFGFHYLVQNVLRIAIEKAGITLNSVIILAVTTVLNLAICTALSVLWGKIKNSLKKKD
ncbi:MAG: hypothetical protein E7571_01065 [Ruminococcaceae bacterium]|nr:hypothetical protein [Oscillospiraceae bacterium]